ncbi:helix-turn-helix transcriptional regulator [Chitinophaga qingshengii]|uniref:Helix-turn-helix transcriptional regulator n=2 Tax=Chitinophaga qingshengii TaxID=1569794 RepID=A0ABR7TXX1_9BACT|nr:helix-turn-helix transcriptional regulator [Chitinophaga qingshengii]
MTKYIFIVERTSTGYSAYAREMSKLPVSTTGKNMRELNKNILEATNLYRELVDLKPATKENIVIRLDMQQFFEYYNVISVKGLAERIGMNPSLLSQYANGIKKPSTKQAHKILDGIKEVGMELSKLEFA